jgi:hypothetical protein
VALSIECVDDVIETFRILNQISRRIPPEATVAQYLDVSTATLRAMPTRGTKLLWANRYGIDSIINGSSTSPYKTNESPFLHSPLR